MTTEQITLELPGTESHGQITLNFTLALTGVLEQAKPRDVTTWQGMAEELGDRLGKLQLVAHRPREIGVGCLPSAIGGILKDRVAELRDHAGDVLMEQLGDMLEIDAAALVEDDSERVGS